MTLRRKAPRLKVDAGVVSSGGAKRSQGWNGWRPDDEFNKIDYGTPADFFDEMHKTYLDAKVRGAVEYIMAHQVGAVHGGAYFRPRGDSPEAIEAANFCNEMFGLGGDEAEQAGLNRYEGRGKFKQDFAHRFRTISTWPLFGLSLHEEVYYSAPDANGDERTWLRDLKPVSGRNIREWHSDEATDEIVAVDMNRPRWDSRGGWYRLPIKNDPEHTGGIKGALHISATATGSDDPEGRIDALLRAASPLRRFKEHCINQLGVGVKRWGSGTLQATFDAELAERLGLQPDTIKELNALAAQAMGDFQSDDGAYLLDSTVLKVGVVEGKFEPDGIVQSINLVDHSMLTTFFMHWLAMGVAQSHGSGAAAITHGNAVLQVVAATAQRTCRELERQTCARLLEINFGPDHPVPELVLPGIEPNPLAGVDVVGMVGSGVLTPTDDVETVIRRQMPGVSLNFPSRTWQDRLNRATGGQGGGATGGRPEGSTVDTPEAVRSHAEIADALATRFAGAPDA